MPLWRMAPEDRTTMASQSHGEAPWMPASGSRVPFPCPEVERPLWGATAPLCGFLIFSARRPARWGGVAGERAARAAWAAPPRLASPRIGAAPRGGRPWSPVSRSVGCRVSRVATLPATPDTDTRRLKMEAPEGKNGGAGGFEWRRRRV